MLQTVIKGLGKFLLLLVGLEIVGYLTVVEPFQGPSDYFVPYLLIPAFAISIAVGVWGYSYEYSLSQQKIRAVFVGISLFCISGVATLFGIVAIFNAMFEPTFGITPWL